MLGAIAFGLKPWSRLLLVRVRLLFVAGTRRTPKTAFWSQRTLTQSPGLRLSLMNRAMKGPVWVSKHQVMLVRWSSRSNVADAILFCGLVTKSRTRRSMFTRSHT